MASRMIGKSKSCQCQWDYEEHGKLCPRHKEPGLFFVQIVSKEKNSQAVRDGVFILPGKRTVWATFCQPLKNPGLYPVREDSQLGVYEYHVAPEVNLSSLVSFGLRSVRVEQDEQVLYDYPRGEYSYRHDQESLVSCKECFAAFPLKDLQSDAIEWGSDSAYSDRVCPQCHVFDCCDVRYETPQEYEERMQTV